MKLFLQQQFLILNFLIPFLAALISVVVSKADKVRLIFKITSLLSLALMLFIPDGKTSYYLGGFAPPIGIEFVLDRLGKHVLIFCNIILFVFALSLTWLSPILEKSTKPEYKKYIYTLILLMHAGTLGIVSTGDIFNLYVFIEIASIASYGLISIGQSRHSVVAALEYLITGTISATLILVGIGFLYVLTGSLNMSDISHRLADLEYSNLLIMACLLFTVGCILKLALFPMHLWLARAYTHTESAILTYIASISVVSGFYVLLRFVHSVTGFALFKDSGISEIFSLLAVIAVLCSSYLAYRAHHFRRIIFYSAIIQVGYASLMAANSSNITLILQYVFADGLAKFLFFAYITLEENGQNCSNSVYVALVNIISNLGLPITVGFFNKVNLLQILLMNSNYIAFVAAIIASVVGVSYNFRMMNHIIRHEGSALLKSQHHLSLYAATIMSFGLIIYVKI